MIPAIASVADLCLLLSGAAAVAIMLRRLDLPGERRKWLVIAIVATFSIKIVLAAVCQSPDVDCFRLFAGLVKEGKSIYSTPLSNYAPTWACMAAGVAQWAHFLAGLFHSNEERLFHVLIAVLLATADVVIGLILIRAYSYQAGLVFLLCPITIMISGARSQIDGLALLCALLAWLMIRDGNPGFQSLLASAALTGLSLTIKHIVFLFPVWLLFWKPLGKLRSRVIYAGAAYLIFFASFLPWWRSAAEIVQNVLNYDSNFGLGFTAHTIGLLLPAAGADPLLVRLMKLAWIGLLFAIGVSLGRKSRAELLLLYFLALYGFSPSVYHQYMIMALITTSVYWRLWPGWAFIVSGTIATLLLSEGLPAIYGARSITLWGHQYVLGQLAEMFWMAPMLYASQFSAIVALVLWWNPASKAESTLPLRIKAFRASVLGAAGYFPWILQIAGRHFTR